MQTSKFLLKLPMESLADPPRERVQNKTRHEWQRLAKNPPHNHHVMIPVSTNWDIGQNPQRIAVVGVATAKMDIQKYFMPNVTFVFA
jgi:hypothetical protein